MSSLAREARRARHNAARYGIGNALLTLGLQVANKFVFLRVCNAFRLTPDALGEDFDELPAGIRAVYADEDLLRPYLDHPETDLPAAFARDALAKGDRCLLIFVDGDMAHYEWCASSPTEVYDGIWLELDPRHAYNYKGFTAPAHRGRQLVNMGISILLKDFASRGFAGFLAFVEAQNEASQRAIRRAGHRRIGRVVILKLGGRTFIGHFVGRGERLFRFVSRTAGRPAAR